MERRQRFRVNVRLQCQVNVRGQPGHHLSNVTENISRTGMLIRWSQTTSAAPAVGEPVMVQVGMPPNPLFGQKWMLFRANVVRVSCSRDHGLMIAVAGSPVRFSSVSKRLPALPGSQYVN